MAIQTEIWTQDIVENLFPPDGFGAQSVSHDVHVAAGAVVHIPKAGNKPTVVRGRSTFPATNATQRTDTDLSYTLTEYSTDPVHMRDASKYELSYDLRMSLIGEHVAALSEAVHDDLLHTWLGTATGLGTLPTTNILDTTGSLVSGKRVVVIADILRLKTAMDKANLPLEGRVLLFSPDMYAQIFAIPELITAEIVGKTTLPTGTASRILGFTVLQRSYTPIYDGARVIRPKGSTPASTDRQSVIAWQKDSVARALGQVSLFESINDPLYYGDVYAALVRAGGIRLRNEGIYALVQANS